MWVKSRTLFLPFLLSLLLLLLSPRGFAAESTYRITAQELEQLDNNLMKLDEINRSNQQELSALKSELTQAKFELNELKAASGKQTQLLQKAEQSLNEYGKEAQRKQRRIKAQRTLAYTLAGALLAAYIYK